MGLNYWSGGGRWGRALRLFNRANGQLPSWLEQVCLVLYSLGLRRMPGGGGRWLARPNDARPVHVSEGQVLDTACVRLPGTLRGRLDLN